MLLLRDKKNVIKKINSMPKIVPAAVSKERFSNLNEQIFRLSPLGASATANLLLMNNPSGSSHFEELAHQL